MTFSDSDLSDLETPSDLEATSGPRFQSRMNVMNQFTRSTRSASGRPQHPKHMLLPISEMDVRAEERAFSAPPHVGGGRRNGNGSSSRRSGSESESRRSDTEWQASRRAGDVESDGGAGYSSAGARAYKDKRPGSGRIYREGVSGWRLAALTLLAVLLGGVAVGGFLGVHPLLLLLPAGAPPLATLASVDAHHEARMPGGASGPAAMPSAEVRVIVISLAGSDRKTRFVVPPELSWDKFLQGAQERLRLAQPPARVETSDGFLIHSAADLAHRDSLVMYESEPEQSAAVEAWTVSDTVSFFVELNLNQYAPVLEKHEVSGRLLLEIVSDDEALAELGIKSKLHISKIRSSLKSMRQ